MSLTFAGCAREFAGTCLLVLENPPALCAAGRPEECGGGGAHAQSGGRPRAQARSGGRQARARAGEEARCAPAQSRACAAPLWGASNDEKERGAMLEHFAGGFLCRASILTCKR